MWVYFWQDDQAAESSGERAGDDGDEDEEAAGQRYRDRKIDYYGVGVMEPACDARYQSK